ncbi:MAG: hypothetical protein BA863_18850 [Desulfovibrio sp. S3730MH75]|nr:MAG: hypothetical protein BA863_18850 [Desulfovibrio sp. S3730MH75]
MNNKYIKPTNANVDEALKEQYAERDQMYWETINGFLASSSISAEDMLKNYPAFIRRRDLPRLLAHYELFKLIKDVPGSIVELGVYLGAGLFTFSKLLETFCPGDRSRKVYGFDTFEGYTNFKKNDAESKEWIEDSIGTKVSNVEMMQKLCDINNLDNFIAGVERSVIIPGDVSKTVPEFAKNPNGLRISLLYFDTNLYEPTAAGLEHLYKYVIPGGIVAFNGFGIPPWEGEAKAFEEFFEGKKMPKLKKMDFSHIPSAYFVKE